MTIVITKQQKPVKVHSNNWLTGEVTADTFFRSNYPSRVSGDRMIFSPKARTAWHIHPKGQTLIILEGVGYIQEWGKPKQTFKAGETVWVPAGVKHWHGATEEGSMSHLTISEIDKFGDALIWSGIVTDEEYHS